MRIGEDDVMYGRLTRPLFVKVVGSSIFEKWSADRSAAEANLPSLRDQPDRLADFKVAG
jgi:hypothetical protein